MSSETIIILPDRPVLRLVVTGLLFAVFGPPIALVFGVTYLSLFAIVGSSADFISAWLSNWAAVAGQNPVSLYFVPFWSVLPALACGLVVGWYEAWRGRVTVFSSLMLGTVCGALFYMLAEFLGWASAVYGASFSVAVCIPAVVILSGVVRAWPGSARFAETS